MMYISCNFMGKNLEECLCEAERQSSILRNKLVYKIIKEEKSIFRKHCEIKVIEKSKNSNLIDIVDNKIIIEVKAKREIKIDTSDKVQAKIFILYTPEYRPVLKYENVASRIKLKKEFEDGEFPPKYTKEDILEVLSLRQIVYGINESVITKVVEMKTLLKIKNIWKCN
ncbi:hypothetical protein [Clostridium paraputrificum]|uniref:RNA-binding protein KhpB N-terminal domain-containing protein n=1 Tax=Clostridium paraputrificum TaxID=29363 RepID=A0A6N3GZA4_9CLOT